ncbi:MAG: dihydrodipicolinate synthase family protein [Candidatus Staskawiczbacteria bacterium]
MSESLHEGAMTAMVTPFTDHSRIDWNGFAKNIQFQRSQGIRCIVPVGTTGESPTITPTEHRDLIHAAISCTRGTGMDILPGCGSNSTEEAMDYIEVANRLGCRGALLVDPYYNGPSSIEIRDEYYGVLAVNNQNPNFLLVPYIIPGRTGCSLAPEDLVQLALNYPHSFRAVKEATGDLNRMLRTRSLLVASGIRDFQIISGDDDKTAEMITSDVLSCGVISVTSNIAPAAVQQMCMLLLRGGENEALAIRNQLAPLFKVVTFLADRFIKGGATVTDKFRNPLPVKIMMDVLGMPAGSCRRPLGRMTASGIGILMQALQTVWKESPWILRPIEEFYGVDIQSRINDHELWEKHQY